MAKGNAFNARPASVTAGNLPGKKTENPALARNVSPPARPLDPKGFTTAFEQLTGVCLSVRWVQLACQKRRIRAAGLGRHLIPPSEVHALAVDFGLIREESRK